MTVPTPRQLALSVLAAVRKGASLSRVLPPALAQCASSREAAFVQSLCYGVCRWYFSLEARLDLLLEKPLRPKDRDIHLLLLLGLYQLTQTKTAVHAAVAETVAAVPVSKPWAKKLVNAVLRTWLRRPPLSPLPARPAHPDWWQRRLQTAWPLQAVALMTADRQLPPLALRVNLQKMSRNSCLKALAEQGISAHALPHVPTGIELDTPMPAETVPFFASGELSVQDAAAQLATICLAPAPGERLLDACAAPGGKTCHLLEHAPGIQLTALDVSEKRLERLKENLARTGHSCALQTGDAADADSWWDGRPFDRILLDVPCSASGIVRRHPDICLLRRETDIAVLANEQYRLLAGLWPLLKPGGMLLYVTCSVFPEENTGVIGRFLADQPAANSVPLQVEWGMPCPQGGRQILPGQHNMDGFYYALLRKKRGEPHAHGI